MTRDDAVVALGANLGDPRAALSAARASLARLGLIVAASDVYRTAPVGGPPGQPDYLNAAVRLRTDLAPGELLRELLRIEREAGRERRERWGPRTLDLDLLLRGDVVLDTPELTLPHPRLMERAFVLAPLAQVWPGWRHPVKGETVEEALARVGLAGVSPEAGAW
ncbi:2-amino-4-hydroxy-6-hydroxymethyldihydropteridine diphosphokinase [Deinococcus pimensis]|uniref:2-amino-4-hydroxy-6- hydroxymethyldihydropteridine diphosphokinase n=1 Tax=Deinococcus pimensis TaxID=309888 RepID=UPI000481ECD2|nr:2-amino-4-hydroxy-6-hydroxymethyldihydropteridine diphosphokinase [Deinococcus pimensis]